MKTIRIIYRYEPEGWWAKSEDLPGWTAVGSSFDEVRKLAWAGALEFAGPQVMIQDEAPSQAESAGVLSGKPLVTSYQQGGTSITFSINVVPQGAPKNSGIGSAKAKMDENLSSKTLVRNS